MKSTPFTEKHIALGAKMAEFAGFNMPISYSGINDEHSTVRNNAGVFDVSHMGEFILKGEKALDLIQRVTSNDASKLITGKAQYSCLPNEEGGIVDDLIVYCLEENKSYMLVVNASNIQKDWDWISKHNTENVEMHNISDRTCLLAIQGPNATKILEPLTDIDILNMKYYTFQKGKFAGVDNVLISATGYTGAGGIEIYFEDKEDHANVIWNTIFAEGTPKGLKPIGLAARDTLRLEMGYCLYGNDIDDITSPLEAGLGWITKFNKDFVGKDILVKVVIAGSEVEFEEVKNLLKESTPEKIIAGRIESDRDFSKNTIASFLDLANVFSFSGANEIIFCEGQLSFKQIISAMQKVPKNVSIKIFANESHAIIGSHDKNVAGDVILKERA